MSNETPPPADATPFPDAIDIEMVIDEIGPGASRESRQAANRMRVHLATLASAQETARQLEYTRLELSQFQRVNDEAQKGFNIALIRMERAEKELAAIQQVIDHWFVQGGRDQFGDLGLPTNADELVSAILRQVRTALQGKGPAA